MLSKGALKITISKDGQPSMTLADVNISSMGTIAKELTCDVDALRWLRVGPILFVGVAIGQVATFTCCAKNVVTLRGPTLMFDVRGAPESAGRGGPVVQYINAMDEDDLIMFAEAGIVFPGDQGGVELRSMEQPLHDIDPTHLIDVEMQSAANDAPIEAITRVFRETFGRAAEVYTMGTNGLQRIGGTPQFQPITLQLSFKIKLGETFPNLIDVFIAAVHSWQQALSDPRNQIRKADAMKQLLFGDELVEHVGEFLERNQSAFDDTTVSGRKAADLLEERRLKKEAHAASKRDS